MLREMKFFGVSVRMAISRCNFGVCEGLLKGKTSHILPKISEIEVFTLTSQTSQNQNHIQLNFTWYFRQHSIIQSAHNIHHDLNWHMTISYVKCNFWHVVVSCWGFLGKTQIYNELRLLATHNNTEIIRFMLKFQLSSEFHWLTAVLKNWFNGKCAVSVLEIRFFAPLLR